MIKNRLHKPTQIYHKGETPIEKNVRVIDEQGNEYEATYPKRAKGLVKHGRARFLSDDLICLACPPNSTDLEDSQMKDFLFHKRGDMQPTPVAPETAEVPEVPAVSATIKGPETLETLKGLEDLETLKGPETLETPEAPEVPETPETPEAPETSETPEAPEAPQEEEISTAYLLEQLEAIRKDTAYLQAAMDKISLMERGDETRAMALSNMAVTREETNQKLIDLYSSLLFRRNPPKMPSFDGWGKKWSDLGNKVKKTVTMEFTPEMDAEIKRQVDQAAQDLQNASEELKEFARHGGESVQRYVNEAFDAIRQATRGRVDIHVGTRGRSTAPKEEKEYSGSTLDMVTEILRDPSLSVEEKELIFDHVDEIRDLEESLQVKVMEILGDFSLSVEEKELILDHLDDLQELS